jgi:hypothetical protein
MMSMLLQIMMSCSSRVLGSKPEAHDKHDLSARLCSMVLKQFDADRGYGKGATVGI